MSRIWYYSQFSASLWRLDARCLKTVVVISSWNIPGANPTCVYCNGGLETVGHSKCLTCAALRPAKGPDCHLWAAVVEASYHQ